MLHLMFLPWRLCDPPGHTVSSDGEKHETIALFRGLGVEMNSDWDEKRTTGIPRARDMGSAACRSALRGRPALALTELNRTRARSKAKLQMRVDKATVRLHASFGCFLGGLGAARWGDAD